MKIAESASSEILLQDHASITSLIKYTTMNFAFEVKRRNFTIATSWFKKTSEYPGKPLRKSEAYQTEWSWSKSKQDDIRGQFLVFKEQAAYGLKKHLSKHVVVWHGKKKWLISLC